MPFESQCAHLIQQLETLIHEEGVTQTAIAGLSISKISHTSDFTCSIYEPSVCFIAQGSKQINLADQNYTYDASSYLISSVHLPLSGKILEASETLSYLAVKLTFTLDQIMDAVREMDTSLGRVCTKQCECALVIGQMDTALFDALIRLIALLQTPKMITTLAPLIIKEILYRLLDHHPQMFMKQFAMMGSYAYRIMQAIYHINTHFEEPLRISQMAHSFGMSNSLFHRNFKKVTALTPIQYQKKVRLQMARKLLLSQHVDAATASFQVGYASPSQFSREYTRMFGLPPRTDTKHTLDHLPL